MSKQEFRSDLVHFSIIDDILYSKYLVEDITEDIATEIINQKLEFLKGKSYHTILKDSGNLKVSKKARNYFSSERGMQGLKNTALVSTNKVNLFIAKFFLKVNNAQRPFEVKVFGSEEEALLWIHETND